MQESKSSNGEYRTGKHSHSCHKRISCGVPLMSRTQLCIWRVVEAVQHGFEQQNISSRAFAPLAKINTTWMHCKAFETLVGTVCMPLCTNVHPHLTYLLLFSLLDVYLKVWCKNAFISLPLSHPCIMMGEWRYSWDFVEVFCSYQCW